MNFSLFFMYFVRYLTIGHEKTIFIHIVPARRSWFRLFTRRRTGRSGTAAGLFQTYIPVNVNIGTCRLDSVLIDFHRKTIRIYADNTFSYQPFRPETVNRIYRDIKEILPGPVTYFDITVFTDGHSINELIPNTYRNGKKDKSRLFTDIHYKDAPWVTRTSRPFEITRGLEGRHIALWQSHGKYYINNKDKWGWQRPRLFCTSEDQFTQSFILPYLIPMLENAGANVFTPRERDTQNRKSL